MTKKQTKNKSPKTTKKQPINVQLSKKDLVELLTVLKNFVQEELLRKERETERLATIDRHRMQERITRLEIEEKARREKLFIISRSCCFHKDKLESISYSRLTGKFVSVNYKCKQCGLKSLKYSGSLSRKEKRALRKLGVKI